MVDFLKLYHHEHDLSGAVLAKRIADARREQRRTGTYTHTLDEIVFGARVAWRNHANCIGRVLWKSLDVTDARHVVDPDAMARTVIEQLETSGRSGNRRPTITIFAAARNGQTSAYFDCKQIVQYAGYLMPDGIVGDPQNVEATRAAIAFGWQPPTPRGHFDLLPFAIREATGRRMLYTLPAGVVREVSIVHPFLSGLAALGLRWYTVPLVSDVILTIGGIDYPAAPFNGFYMATEIASRNLADVARYNVLERVATAISIDRNDPLWQDQTLVELNRAVLHSFSTSGAAIIDHHVASRQYLDFVRLEHAAGRVPSGNWDWIVPPQASAACPVFHLPMNDYGDVPNFYRARAQDGARLGPARLTEQRGRARRRLDRTKLSLRRWLRARG